MKHNYKWKSYEEKFKAYLDLCDFAMELYFAGKKNYKKSSKSRIIKEILRKMHNDNIASKKNILNKMRQVYGF